jgi:hypothetical protein
MRRDEHISGHWIWTDVFVKRQGRWQVVASQETLHGGNSNPTFRKHQGRPMSGRLFFCITLKVGADNCRNQAFTLTENLAIQGDLMSSVIAPE